MCKNCEHLGLECSFQVQAQQRKEKDPAQQKGGLNLLDIRLFYHYTKEVCQTISQSGIFGNEVWATEVPTLAFEYPFLMHAILTISATHLLRTHRGVPENVVTVHRGEALQKLRQEVLKITHENLDALVAASILLILDSLANASLPDETSPRSLPASAWLHHVRGAATILMSVQPLPPESLFYELISIDLSDLAMTQTMADGMQLVGTSGLECFDEELRDLYPVHTSSPYFQALVWLDKLYHQREKSDFILRVFSFPVFLDKNLIDLLIQGDEMAKRIIKVYYKFVRSFTDAMHDSVWFLEGVARVLPIDMDAEFGGLGFITNALPVERSVEQDALNRALKGFDAGIIAGLEEQSMSNSLDDDLDWDVDMEFDDNEFDDQVLEKPV